MKDLFTLLRRPLLYVAGFSFLVNLLLLTPALFMLQVFDRVLTSQSLETLWALLAGMVVALGLMLMLDHLRSRLQGVIGNLVGEQLAPVVARTMLARSARGRGPDGSAEGLRDVAGLRNLFSAQGLLALFDTPWALVYLAVIWLAHPILGIAAAGAAGLMVALAVLNDRLTRRGIEAVQRDASAATRYLESSLQNAEVVQSLGMAPALVARWQALNTKVTQLQQPTARRSVGIAAFTRATRQAVQVGMQALGAYLVITGEGTPGILVATTILLGRALVPVEQVVASWRVLAEGRISAVRLNRLLAEVDAEPARMALPPPTGRLHAQGIVYRLPQGERVVLANVSLHLEAGESLAVVGASGAGKSTLVRLLSGLWKPTAGEVRLDDVELTQWPREALGPWLGYVPQDVELFDGTVAENIARLGTVDPAAVTRAAQRAGVHEFILSLPEGYDTLIEPGGYALSPGQRQRIAFARALYGSPRLLILDEPNSNLDGAGEIALGEAIRALKGEVTVVMVTHRSTLVHHMDKMLVLEAGRVQHYGPVKDVVQAIAKSSPAGTGGQVVPMARSTAVPDPGEASRSSSRRES